ncbi:MAG: Eco57I restriction-modification methylase domain-containing protein [Candidatus Lokiarchaeota archaeon]|nr:Eco57I restriction-modification methylase domain-containing protein [Candidatus Lokiarchaeota archaeon]
MIYINYSQFINKISSDIINYYINNLHGKDQKNKILGRINLLIQKYKIAYSNDEINNLHYLGPIYEDMISYSSRKLTGEIYTHKRIVKYILNSIGYKSKNKIEKKKIVDISCGAGSFLLEALNRLLKKYCIKYNIINIQNSSSELLKKIINKIKKSIYGIDINPIACILCQITLQLALFKFYNRIIKNDSDYPITLFNIENKNSFEHFQKNIYDYVVGNPPYLFIRDIPIDQRNLINILNFKTNRGQYDYYQIFIELGLNILKKKGKLGYIIPDSLLVLSNKSIIREFIINTSCIKELYYIGPSFVNSVVSNIIIILQKIENKDLRNNNEILVKINSEKSENIKKIKQSSLKEWDNRFIIDLNKEEINIIEHLNHNFPKLEDLNNDDSISIKIKRGVELSKKGFIFKCDHCNKFFPLPKKEKNCRFCDQPIKNSQVEKIIIDDPPEKNINDYLPYIYSINRYYIKKYKYINIKKEGIQYKNFNNYIDRIIIRQIGQGRLLCATYIEKICLCSQSFYNLKIKQSESSNLSNYYLLGLINSHLLSFYYTKLFGSYKRLFPRILIEKIRQLPIKIPESQIEKEKANRIRNNIQKLLQLKNNITNEENQRIQKEIDFDIYDLYLIEKKHQEYIENFFN